MLRPLPMPRPRHLFSALLFFLVALFAGRASAQSVVIPTKASPLRRDSGGVGVDKRKINPEAVNFSDCFANQSIDLPYQASGFTANQTLEVWAGQQDCKPIAARQGTNQQCWRPAGNLPLQQAGTVIIPVRNIITRRTDNKVGDYSRDSSVCKDIPLSTFSLYFMWFQGTGSEPIGTTEQVDLQVKTAGPPALSGLKVLPGNRRLVVTFNAAGEAGVTDQQGIRVYCDDKLTSTVPAKRTVTVCPDSGPADAAVADADGTDAAVTDAEVSDAEGSDAAVDAGCTTTTETTSGGSACTSSNLLPATPDGGVPSLPDAKYLCAELGGNTGSRIVVEGIGEEKLKNDKRYAVAVAAVDSFGNVGALSDAICETPGETSDFWQVYRDSGGQAGGCSPSAAPPGGLLAGIPFLALVGSLIRRRVRKGRTSSR